MLRTYVRNTYTHHLSEIFSTVVNEYTDWERTALHPINTRDATVAALSDAQFVAPLVQTGDAIYRTGPAADTGGGGPARGPVVPIASSGGMGAILRTDGTGPFFYVFDYQTKEGDYPPVSWRRLGGRQLTRAAARPTLPFAGARRVPGGASEVLWSRSFCPRSCCPRSFCPRSGRSHAGRGHAGGCHAVRGHAGRGHAVRGHSFRGHAGRGRAGRGLAVDAVIRWRAPLPSSNNNLAASAAATGVATVSVCVSGMRRPAHTAAAAQRGASGQAWMWCGSGPRSARGTVRGITNTARQLRQALPKTICCLVKFVRGTAEGGGARRGAAPRGSAARVPISPGGNRGEYVSRTRQRPQQQRPRAAPCHRAVNEIRYIYCFGAHVSAARRPECQARQRSKWRRRDRAASAGE
ncbi:hypothetical protein ONE63_010232 [Megalurothrips usitatus]|uniref:Uncharacterized protein n=1 Tax=Megalurothrips usitatus TaxID=439358 RepID=A0AAV7XI36_9NEOP|nr:hypothetical protein ONE63_010232 [Megalurothrips usitatus]